MTVIARDVNLPVHVRFAFDLALANADGRFEAEQITMALKYCIRLEERMAKIDELSALRGRKS